MPELPAQTLSRSAMMEDYDREKANTRAEELVQWAAERGVEKLAARCAILEQYWDKAMEEATTDVLTGVSTRRAVMDALETELGRTRRYGTATAVLMLDLDNFKAINDKHGHQAGDAVLRVVGELVKDSLRATDTAGRYGGEEFLVVMSQTNPTQARTLAEKLRRRVSMLKLTGIERITISIGVAGTLPVKGLNVSPEDVVGWADKALYKAKEHGRNLVVEASQ